jgi:hypothetical protein
MDLVLPAPFNKMKRQEDAAEYFRVLTNAIETQHK